MAFTAQPKSSVPVPGTVPAETGSTVPAPTAKTPEDKTPVTPPSA